MLPHLIPLVTSPSLPLPHTRHQQLPPQTDVLRLSYLHLHRVQSVAQLQLVGYLVNRREAPAELVTDLLQRAGHLGAVHCGVHLDNSIPATS